MDKIHRFIYENPHNSECHASNNVLIIFQNKNIYFSIKTIKK